MGQVIKKGTPEADLQSAMDKSDITLEPFEDHFVARIKSSGDLVKGLAIFVADEYDKKLGNIQRHTIVSDRLMVDHLGNTTMGWSYSSRAAAVLHISGIVNGTMERCARFIKPDYDSIVATL